MRLLAISLCLGLSITAAVAGDVEGSIVVKRKLTRRNITVSAGSYERGPLVPVHATKSDDALDYERSHVVVYLEDAAPPSHPISAVLEQKDRAFAPDLLVVPAGSSVSFPNGDPIFHNVFSLSKPKTFDLGNYSRGQTRTVRFDRPGIVVVNCHLHSNMAAVIVVTPNSVATRAGSDGTFKLTDVPAGRHTLVAWHKTAGLFRQVVDVGPGQTPAVSFFIPLDENGAPIQRVAAAGQ